jgi:hypothetical protein
MFVHPDTGSSDIVEHRGVVSKKLRDALKAAEETFWAAYNTPKAAEPPQKGKL